MVTEHTPSSRYQEPERTEGRKKEKGKKRKKETIVGIFDRMFYNRLVTKVLEQLNEERRGAKSKKKAEWKPKDQRLLMALGRHREHASAHDRCYWSWTTEKMQPEP